MWGLVGHEREPPLLRQQDGQGPLLRELGALGLEGVQLGRGDLALAREGPPPRVGGRLGGRDGLLVALGRVGLRGRLRRRLQGAVG